MKFKSNYSLNDGSNGGLFNTSGEVSPKSSVKKLVELEERLRQDADKAIFDAQVNFSRMIEELKIENDEQLKKFDEKIEKISKDYIGVIALFVALFTFVSIDFQILKSSIDIYGATGLVLIMAAVLFGFLLILMTFLELKQLSSMGKWFSIILIGLMLGGLALLHLSYVNHESKLRGRSSSEVIKNSSLLIKNPTFDATTTRESGILTNTSTYIDTPVSTTGSF